MSKTTLEASPTRHELIEHLAPRSDLLQTFQASRQHDLASDWMRWLAGQVELRQLAADSVATYRRGLSAWLVFLDTVARTDRPTPATVAAYLAALIPGRKPATVNLHLSALRAFYRWAESGDHHPDIARSAKALRVCRDGPMPCLSHDQVVGLLSSIAGADLKALRDRALLITLYGTACRTVSLARATVADLDLVAGTLHHQTKGHQSADSIAYLPASALKALGEYLAARSQCKTIAAHDPLFIALDRRSFGSALTTHSMRAVVRCSMLSLGHARRDADGRLVAPGIWSAHSLRRSSLTRAADRFGLEAARVLAGHSAVEITRRAYVRSKMDEQLRQVSKTLDLTVIP